MQHKLVRTPGEWHSPPFLMGHLKLLAGAQNPKSVVEKKIIIRSYVFKFLYIKHAHVYEIIPTHSVNKLVGFFLCPSASSHL